MREHPAAEKCPGILSKCRLARHILHVVKLQYGTYGFTSPPKEGVLRIFFRHKNPTGRVRTRELGYLRPARYLYTTEAANAPCYYKAKLSSRLSLGSTQSPTRWVKGAAFLRVKGLGL